MPELYSVTVPSCPSSAVSRFLLAPALYCPGPSSPQIFVVPGSFLPQLCSVPVFSCPSSILSRPLLAPNLCCPCSFLPQFYIVPALPRPRSSLSLALSCPSSGSFLSQLSCHSKHTHTRRQAGRQAGTSARARTHTHRHTHTHKQSRSRFWCMLWSTLLFSRVLRVLTWLVFVSYLVLYIFRFECYSRFLKEFSAPPNTILFRSVNFRRRLYQLALLT